MTDREHKDLQEIMELWNRLNETNRGKAVELAAELLAEQIARREKHEPFYA